MVSFMKFSDIEKCPPWGAFTYDVRCFWVIFDLPTLIRYRQMWLDLPTYIHQNLTSDFQNFTSPIRVHNNNMDHPTMMSPHFPNHKRDCAINS
jgi:hypothetical protein